MKSRTKINIIMFKNRFTSIDFNKLILSVLVWILKVPLLVSNKA